MSRSDTRQTDVDIASMNDRERWIVHTTVSFNTIKAAMAHAEALPDDGRHGLVNVTTKGASDGWKRHHVAQRKNGEWKVRATA